MMSMRSLYRFRRSDEGATAVEAAFVILAFVLLIFGLVQFAEIFWTWNTMILALGEGGRYAMVYNPRTSLTGSQHRAAVSRRRRSPIVPWLRLTPH
jgi:pilus assembly protein Flp/PilA